MGEEMKGDMAKLLGVMIMAFNLGGLLTTHLGININAIGVPCIVFGGLLFYTGYWDNKNEMVTK